MLAPHKSDIQVIIATAVILLAKAASRIDGAFQRFNRQINANGTEVGLQDLGHIHHLREGAAGESPEGQGLPVLVADIVSMRVGPSGLI